MATKTKTQTKTKTATRKQSGRKSNGGVTLPSGYTVVGRAPNWDFEKNAVLEGVRGETHEVIMDEGTKKERKSRNCIVTTKDGQAFTLWESGTLRDFFDQTEDGDQIRVEFVGMGVAKKGQNAPKLFQAAVKR